MSGMVDVACNSAVFFDSDGYNYIAIAPTYLFSGREIQKYRGFEVTYDLFLSVPITVIRSGTILTTINEGHK